MSESWQEFLDYWNAEGMVAFTLEEATQPWICQICADEFPDAREALLHVANTHTGEGYAAFSIVLKKEVAGALRIGWRCGACGLRGYTFDRVGTIQNALANAADDHAALSPACQGFPDHALFEREGIEALAKAQNG